MGHPQQATEIITDNSTAGVIIIRTIKQKVTKAMDMQFYWIRDEVEHNNFELKWKPGNMTLGDYFNKRHQPTHHLSMRQTYLVNTIVGLQERILCGCAKTRNLGAEEHGA